MPELPEVEVSRMGITPHMLGQTIVRFIFRTPKLRWAIPAELYSLQGCLIERITRRGKYLQIETQHATAVVHLGMSGSLRVLETDIPPGKHDHVDLVLSNGKILRYNDPRRFGAWLWCPAHQVHPLLRELGPEPLSDEFNAAYMAEKAQHKKVVVKTFIMNSHIVVGVGNIYANESLFAARIHPERAAGSLSGSEWQRLVIHIKETLRFSIQQGGTTLKDFSQVDGKPGYFAQKLQVYGKGGEPCPVCGTLLTEKKIGQRNTVFCSQCQH